MNFRKLRHGEYPWKLLLEADPSLKRVESYLKSGLCIGGFENNDLIGVYVLLKKRPDQAELMNIAVDSRFQGKGYGKLLIADCVRRCREDGIKQLEVGTGNSSIDQLAFYQKCGFRINGVDQDFFVRNYPEPIVENGIPCRDMVRLQYELD